MAVAALTLMSTPDAIAIARSDQPANPAPPASSRTPDPVIADLLHLRAKPATAAASRSARRTTLTPTLTPAQRRAIVNNQRRANVVKFARAQRGKLYRYGASGPRNYDCSGLTKASFSRGRVSLPHQSGAQRRRGVRTRSPLPGDLVTYNGHVGVYVGAGRMVDAPGRGRRILERRVYRGNGLQYRRLIS